MLCIVGGREGISQATTATTSTQPDKQTQGVGAQPQKQTSTDGTQPQKQTQAAGVQPQKQVGDGKDKKGLPKSVAGFDLQTSATDVMSHLNAVIGFYRASMLPIQKAGEPNDVVYYGQSADLAGQAAGYAFQSAQAEAALASAHMQTASGNQQRLQATKAAVEQRLVLLKARSDDLDKQLTTAKAKDVAALKAQKKDVQAAIDLNTSMDEAVAKIVGIGGSGSGGGGGLVGDIERLQHSVPELTSKTKVVPPQLTTLEAARSSGVSSQGAVLFQLLETKHSLDGLLAQNEDARKKAQIVRAPISSILTALIARGQTLSEQAANAALAPPVVAAAKTAVKPAAKAKAKGVIPAPPVAAAPTTPAPAPAAPTPTETLMSITSDFKALAAAAVPLSQELIVLDESKANLTAWRASVQDEYGQILHALLARIVVIAIALGLIFIAGEVWRRGTNKYVHDIRRRRQILIVRRVAIGFLSVIVVLFGFVTQFNSLATFAGFITAGIAVGLQTILLSVAAYFFIIGRYGIKVGDRITVASVTGDVIDVGLVRFYLMELAGTGLELNPTGRVAVFSNAVLFQAGTPLYKQIPGTEFAWRELSVKLATAADYTKVSEAIMKEVSKIYDGYRVSIEQQHRDVEYWMQAPIAAPGVESRLQFSGGAVQLWARFPVEIGSAAKTEETLTKTLLQLMDNAEYKEAFAGTPVIQASVRG
jgi:small-conductance mechanosensitive channel